MLPSLHPSPFSARARALAFVGLLAGFWGCPASGSHGLPTTPPLTTTDPEAEADLRAADRAAEAGRAGDAERLYRMFLDRHPADPVAPLATLGLGRVLLSVGRGDEALALFERVSQETDPVLAERGRFHRGIALHLLGRHAEALSMLEPLAGRLVEPQDNALLLRTLAAASLSVGNSISALRALDELSRTESAVDAAEARTRMVALADRELPADQVERAYLELDREGAAWPRVALRALRAAYDRGDVPRVREIAADVRAQGVELSEEVASLVLRADRIAVADPRVIGAILPLTGRGREVGQAALRGLMLAAGLPPGGPPSVDSAEVIFRDDAGDPERAARAVEELVSIHRAIAIIGPLEGAAAEAAATRAQQLGVPLLALTPSDSTLRTGTLGFRLFPAPSGEFSALLRVAREQRAERIAILRPESPFGDAMRTSLLQALGGRGSDLVADVRYPPSSTSFQAQVAELVRARPDAIVVADSGRQLALIAPALTAGGLVSGRANEALARGRRVLLLLPSVAFDSRLPQSAGRYLEGALFSVPFHAPTATAEARAFTDAYLARWSTEPDTFAAYSFDAFNLLWRTIRSGANTRESLVRSLTSGVTLPTAGASGGLGANRDSRNATRILELRGGLFVPVETR